MKYFFDSNVFIYFLNDQLSSNGQQLIVSGLREGSAYSVITRIEVLGFTSTQEQINAALRLLDGFIEVGLNESILQRTIHMRQRYRRLKIPDAIIAATAIELALPLVTRNVDDFKEIASLHVMDPFVGINEYQ